jgi:hypothetical protein
VRNYYILAADSGENLDTGLRIYQKYNKERTDKVNMWIYSKSEISEVIFDYLYETFNVRLINEEGLIARSLVTAHPLYEARDGDRLSVLILGGGSIGLEIVRSVAMCSCLGDDVKSEINVIDLEADKAKKTLEKTSPGLIDRWNIAFHSADVKRDDLSSVLEGIDPTYVVLCLGNETLNLETALYIRRKYGSKNGLPLIHALVDHKKIEEQILPNLCISDWKYNALSHRFESTPICSFEIKPFGSYEETYKDLRIGASYRDCLAVAQTAASRGISSLDEKITPETLGELYNQVCFYKDYADAYAVSVPYKLYLMGLELKDDSKGDLSLLEERLPEHVDILVKHENLRYEAFMRSKGWAQLPLDEIKDDTLRDKLKMKIARLDCQYTEELARMTGRDFKAEDARAVMRLTTVISLANALYGKGYSVKEKE